MDMHQMEERMYRSAALAHSITFTGLDPYELDNLCEMLFAEYERFIIERQHSKLKNSAINVAEYKHLYILGMRKHHLKQIYLQKVSYESFHEAQRLFARFTTELTDKEKARHREQYKEFFEEIEREKKDPARRSRQGLKVSGVRKKAA
jgi:hypothetical protein